MTIQVFPELSGITWDIKKRPTFNTSKLLTAAGNEFRTGYRVYPITEFDLSYSYMALADKLTMEGFFNQMLGSLTPFYFDFGVATRNTDDNSLTNFGFGTGDGSSVAFTLLKPAGSGSVEPIGGVNVINDVYINGTATTAYTVGGNVLTFTTAPAANAVLTWTGSFYYITRFTDDKLEFNQLANLMYELGNCQLVTVQ